MFTVTVSDPKMRTAGFQLSARLATDPANGQAGDFTSGPGEIVICDNNNLKTAQGCPPATPVQFIEHGVPKPSGTWTVTWTPPQTDVGDVFIFVAGNAANGDNNPTGDHIYTAHYTLTAVDASAAKPSISQVNVAAAFNAKAPIASGTWVEIYGTNLSPAPARLWSSVDFDGANAPTSLNGVSVTVNGKRAYTDYVSSGQVNAQVPDGVAAGSAQLVVTNAGGASNSVTVSSAATAPALLAPLAWNVNGKQYVVAQFTASPNIYAGPAGLISGLQFRPAKAGDLITIYGIGFGMVTPDTSPGTVAPQSATLQTKPSFLFGQAAGDVSCSTGCYAGLAPFAVGLYQFNIKVPSGPTGDVPLTVNADGVSTNQMLYITLQ